MSKFRIVEERSVQLIANTHMAVPRYYVEVSNRFLFWTIWDRYLMGYDSLDEAIAFMNAVSEKERFKRKVITS